MKTLLILSLLFLPVSAMAQFHVTVEPNPFNGGQVNPEWVNNYAVMFTEDNWRTKESVKGQVTYQGYDDNGVEFYSSYYEIKSFKNNADAIAFARKFKTISIVRAYMSSELQKHQKLDIKYKAIQRRPCFRCHAQKNIKAKTTAVY